MNNVLTYGTFDLFHYGHLRLLQRASTMGKLHVGVSTDEFNQIKGKKTIFPYIQRKLIVQSIDCVYRTFGEYNWEQKIRDIEKYKIDIFVMGNDWEGSFDDLPCKIIYLPRTQSISTTEIKRGIYENCFRF